MLAGPGADISFAPLRSATEFAGKPLRLAFTGKSCEQWLLGRQRFKNRRRALPVDKLGSLSGIDNSRPGRLPDANYVFWFRKRKRLE